MANITIDPKMQPPSMAYPGKGSTAGIGSDAPEPGVDLGDQIDKGQYSPVMKEETTAVDNEQESISNTESASAYVEMDSEKWMGLSKVAYDISTDYFDNNVRPVLDDSIKAFYSQHPSGSHFSSTSKFFTSKLYRPKTRSVIDSHEADADLAFFSNRDVVSIEPENGKDKEEVMSAEAMKALVQYRLTKKGQIPWYKIVIGGFQDAQVQGLVCGHYYWEVNVDEKESEDKSLTKILKTDKPAMELVPLEHMRWDPSASWVDIVGTSPFLIRLKPMYVSDLKTEIKSGFFIDISDDDIMSSITQHDGLGTRLSRNQSRQDPQDKASKNVSDYEIVMVQEHIHRIDDQDYVWYTLGKNTMLRKPVPIEEIYFHGRRPYVIGSAIIETHKTYTSSVPALLRQLQDEMNTLVNQRMNNVSLVLNKKYVIKEDSMIDLSALLRNQPGSAVYAEDPEKDVRELATPDVTSSSYQEQDRLNADFDDVAGSLSQSSQMQTGANGGNQQTFRGMAMLDGNSDKKVEHKLRIYSETFVLEMLCGLILLEQYYETDDTVFTLIGNQTNLQRFGVDKLTNEHLQKQMTINVNVGMNNTDPQKRQQRFVGAVTQYLAISANPAARLGLDMKEVGKELFGGAGFGDGTRFLNPEVTPEVAHLTQENMMLRKKVMDKSDATAAKVAIARDGNRTRLEIEGAKIEQKNQHFLVDHMKELQMKDMEYQQSKQQQQPAPGAQPPGM